MQMYRTLHSRQWVCESHAQQKGHFAFGAWSKAIFLYLMGTALMDESGHQKNVNGTRLSSMGWARSLRGKRTLYASVYQDTLDNSLLPALFEHFGEGPFCSSMNVPQCAVYKVHKDMVG